MHVHLHNIGPIRSADIELSPLTVLVGPNGSGKTTVSSVMYAAATAASRASRVARVTQRPRLASHRAPDDGLEGFIERVIETWEETFRDAFEDELRRCCSRDLRMLGRELRAGKGAAPRIAVADRAGARRAWRIIFRIDSARLVIERSNRDYLRPKVPHDEGPESPAELRRLDMRLRRALSGGLPSRTVYFPASRSGFMQTYGALTALVWGALGGGYFEKATVGAIPGTAADFLQFLAQLRLSTQSDIDQTAVEIIENELLKGSVALLSSEASPEVVFRPHGFSQSWPIEAAATSAAELAPLVLYLRHHAAPRDAVFIDEPEAHFHPASQVALARALSAASAELQGLMIATHSEFLVGELSNLLLEQFAADGQGSLFSRSGLQVYEFKVASPRTGVCVERLDIDPSAGFEIEQFSQVADTTYRRAVTLFNAIHATEDE